MLLVRWAPRTHWAMVYQASTPARWRAVDGTSGCVYVNVVYLVCSCIETPALGFQHLFFECVWCTRMLQGMDALPIVFE